MFRDGSAFHYRSFTFHSRDFTGVCVSFSAPSRLIRDFSLLFMVHLGLFIRYMKIREMGYIGGKKGKITPLIFLTMRPVF